MFFPCLGVYVLLIRRCQISTMSLSGSEYTAEEEEFRDDMRVFLRLRPINKLEQSRRSKNCIELHEDPTLVTVDSPLEGEYDYTFDHVSRALWGAIDDDSDA